MEVRTATLRRRGTTHGSASPLAWVRRRLDVPLYRNGYALVASSGLTSVLGLVYWLVAARAYSATAVGVSAALISAMTLLANLAQLNLKTALNRFLPTAGRTSGRFITRSYVVALAVAAVASLVFLVGLGLWSPKLQFLADRPLLALWFVAATMAWTIFVLQDAVLAGIRQAAWVPVENLAYAVSKIVLLVVFAAVAPTLGAFLAWSAPLLLLVVPVNLLLFRRLIPAHVKTTEGRERPAPARQVAQYVAADYVAYLISAATIGALPLVVLAVSGAEANAYYFVAWSIAYALYLIAGSMGMAMIAEASLEPERLAAHARRAVIETAALVVPAVAVVVLAAPAILSLLGDSYAGEGAGLLRLLALSAVPWMVFVAYTNMARVRRRMRAVVVANAALYGLVLAIGLPLLGTLGIEGLGVGWLAAQTIVAAVIVAGHVTRGFHGDWREGLVRFLSGVRLLAVNWWRRLVSVTALRTALADLRSGARERRGWVVRRHLRTLNDVAVSAVGPARGAAAALVKRACSGPSGRALMRHEASLRALREEPGLEEFAGLVPEVLASGEAGGRRYLAETCMPGVSSEALLRGGADQQRMLMAIQMAIRPLHDATASKKQVGEPLLRPWVDAPLARLLPAVRGHSGLMEAGRAMKQLRRELRDELMGRQIDTARIHGDLCPGNVLMRADGTSVGGIVDWEESRESAPPELDMFHLMITTRMAVEGRELGAIVAELLRKGTLSSSARSYLLLTWLHHVAANVGKSARYGRSRVWIRRNIDPVLEVVLEGAHGTAALPALPSVGFGRRAGRRWASLRARFGAARLELLATVGALSLSVGLWVASLDHIDPRAMTDTGLISVLPVTFAVGLGLLTASFVTLVLRHPERSALLVGHLLALVAFLHATPSVVYGTLRYSWAWKHVGIVDYLQRYGEVNPHVDFLEIYHNWPGFFGLDALLIELAGIGSTLELARWGPVFFNVLSLGAIVFVLSTLTRDKRLIWIGAWLFFIANWVGQDYFSPQAFAFFLYLVALGVVLRWLRRDSEHAVRKGAPRAAMTALVLIVVAAIAASHALTGVMVVVSLAALAVWRVGISWLLPVASAGVVALWDLVFATNYVSENAAGVLEKIRLPWTTTESSLTDPSQLSDGQVLVATVARGLVVGIAVLAAIGLLRQLRGRELNRAAIVLAAAPVLLFASGDYDGEILFRIFLFAVPFLAFLAAYSLLDRPVFMSLACAVVTAAFVVAYYGKEHQNYFSPAEVAAARHVYEKAPPGTLLIEGTRNYPTQFENYERFRYVTISRESPAARRRLVENPEPVLERWMSGPDPGLLIITRSQKAEVDELGVMPRGSLDRIERDVRLSARFKTVFQNRDAAVYTLAETPVERVSR